MFLLDTNVIPELRKAGGGKANFAVDNERPRLRQKSKNQAIHKT